MKAIVTTAILLLAACASSPHRARAAFSPVVLEVSRRRSQEEEEGKQSTRRAASLDKHTFTNYVSKNIINWRRSLLYNHNNVKNRHGYHDDKNNKLQVIPILGPFVNAPPLMLGGEMLLDPPTPLQWKALQECIVEHFNQKSMGCNDSGFKNNSDDDDVMQCTTTIDASPLIAIIDEATSRPDNAPLRSTKGRYATLAAIVGIKTHRQIRRIDDEDAMIDDDDNGVYEESFWDYYDNNFCSIDDKDRTFILPMSSCVRLIGVGRARLKRYFYRVPSDSLSNNDNDANDDVYDHDILNHGYEDNTPIVMAEFEHLVDDISIYSGADPDKIGDKHQRSHRMSPVHALSELNNAVLKVSRIHDYRRRLVAGIRTAKARLHLFDENLQDVDGLGLLFENKKKILDDDKTVLPEMTESGLSCSNNSMETVDLVITKMELHSLQSMENYGMGYYGAFSSIDDLTNNLSLLLEPYYSKTFRERDEYKMEISSFVSFQCLFKYTALSDMSWSLQCTSTIERLNRAYEIMFDHAFHLKKLAEKLSQELDECGEECTDLW